ncbi:hypothetical protein D3C72_923510 [compost metagenome]
MLFTYTVPSNPPTFVSPFTSADDLLPITILDVYPINPPIDVFPSIMLFVISHPCTVPKLYASNPPI